jgi:signal transduction histidine kinase
VQLFDMTQPPLADLPNPYGIKVVLTAPMRIGDQLVGLLTLDYGGADHEYTPAELALARAVARLGALAIERERLLRERAQAQANELALRDANQRMNEFLSVASHELKTPVTVIRTNVQLLNRRLKPPQAAEAPADDLARTVTAVRPLLDGMGRSSGRLTLLVDDLLDVSRIHAGKLSLRPEPCDLADVLREAVDEQRHLHAGRTIDLALPVRQVPVVADAHRIGQAVTNYLTNALKYSPADQPVEMRLEIEGDRARVAVRDHGPGLPAEEHEQVWELYHRVHGVEVQSGSGVGLGLGLYISKSIVERHGGHVGVESAPGRGATFWFTLPLAPQPATP